MSHFKVSPFESPPLLKRPKTTNCQNTSIARRRQLLLQQLAASQKSSAAGTTSLHQQQQIQQQLIQQQLEELGPGWLGPGARGIAERRAAALDNSNNSNNTNTTNYHKEPEEDASVRAWREWKRKKDELRKQQRQQQEAEREAEIQRYGTAHGSPYSAREVTHLSLSSPPSPPSRYSLTATSARNPRNNSNKNDKTSRASPDKGDALVAVHDGTNATVSDADESSAHQQQQHQGATTKGSKVKEEHETNVSLLRQRSQNRQVSVFNLASARRAEERASWMRSQIAKHEKRQQVLHERDEDKKQLRAALDHQKQNRDEYLAALLSEKAEELRSARHAAAHKVICDKAASSTLLGGGSALLLQDDETEDVALNRLDPQLVLEQMRKDRLAAAAMMMMGQALPGVAEQADERRRARRRGEDELRSRRLDDLSARRGQHDTVVVAERASSRVRQDIADVRVANIQDRTIVEKQKWKGLVDEQDVGRKDRIKQLTEERKDQVARRYENVVKHHEHLASIHDEVSIQRKAAAAKRREVMDTEGPAYEEKRIRAEKIRRETSLSARLNREEVELERQMIAFRMRSDIDERRRMYELEARQELQMRREAADRVRRAESRAATATGTSGSSPARQSPRVDRLPLDL